MLYLFNVYGHLLHENRPDGAYRHEGPWLVSCCNRDTIRSDGVSMVLRLGCGRTPRIERQLAQIPSDSFIKMEADMAPMARALMTRMRTQWL